MRTWLVAGCVLLSVGTAGALTKADVRRQCRVERRACLQAGFAAVRNPVRAREVTYAVLDSRGIGQLTLRVASGPRLELVLRVTDGALLFCPGHVAVVQGGQQFPAFDFFTVDEPVVCDSFVAGVTATIGLSAPPAALQLSEPFTVVWRGQTFDVP